MIRLLKNLRYVILCFGSVLFCQQSFEEFKKQQNIEFQKYKDSITNQYKLFEKAEIDSLEKFKKEIELKWKDFKSSTNNTYVSYDKDLQSRAIIDYKNGILKIEIIFDDNLIEKESFNYFNKDKFNLKFSYNSILPFFSSILLNSNKIVFFNFQNSDHIRYELEQNKSKPVFNKIVEDKLIKKLLSIISENSESSDAFLEDQLLNDKGEIVKKGINDKSYAAKKIQQSKINITKYRSKDGLKRTSYDLEIKLTPDHKKRRIKKYQKEIIKQSKRFKIDPSIAMAITETESSFNPKATSHIPAYGLMQLVPKSGARDAYNFVYNKDKFLNKRYLYKPKNNIELGCAYIAKIRYEYFKSVKDPEKAYLCTIAAYNTGPGNVAKALTNSTKLKPTARVVNKMSSEKLYNTLIRDLEYKETQNYLKNVWSRKDKYKNI